MKKVGALELTRVKVRDLRQHPNNPNQGDIGIIVESLESHGYMKPVLVQKSTMRIIAGNHTVQATEIEGFEEIDVILRDCTDEEALRIMLMDNESSRKSNNDRIVLTDILESLVRTEYGLRGTGFTGEDLDDLIHEFKPELQTNPIDEWENMPEFEQEDINSAYRCTVHFLSEKDRDDFFKLLGRDFKASIWWPEGGDGMTGGRDSTAQWVADEN